jgi:hypothetical protein
LIQHYPLVTAETDSSNRLQEAELKVLLVQHDIDDRIGPFSQGSSFYFFLKLPNCALAGFDLTTRSSSLPGGRWRQSIPLDHAARASRFVVVSYILNTMTHLS